MEYLTFVGKLDELPQGEQGEEMKLVVKNLSPGQRKYEARRVKAVVARSPQSMPGADTLWVRFSTGLLHPQPWAIRIVAELGQ